MLTGLEHRLTSCQCGLDSHLRHHQSELTDGQSAELRPLLHLGVWPQFVHGLFLVARPDALAQYHLVSRDYAF